MAEAQEKVHAVFQQQERAQFGHGRLHTKAIFYVAYAT
jgi:hypothetical protein